MVTVRGGEQSGNKANLARWQGSEEPEQYASHNAEDDAAQPLSRMVQETMNGISVTIMASTSR
jgi:hypothetical protein